MTITKDYVLSRLTGEDGKNGKDVKIEYSADGTNWHPDFQDDDYYMHISTDGGVVWGDPMKVVGEDGVDAKFVEIDTSEDGTVFLNGSPEQITLKAVMRGFTASADDIEWYKGNARLGRGLSYTTKEAGVFKVSVNDGTDVYEDSVTVMAVNDGKPSDSYNLELSMTEKNGAVNLAVYKNGVKALTETFYYIDYYGVDNLETVRQGTVYNGEAVLEAVEAGQHLIKIFKDEIHNNLIVTGYISYGADGESAVTYWLTEDATQITKYKDGSLSQNTINFSAKSKKGSGNVEPYSGRFKIYYSTDGYEYTVGYTSETNESSHIYTIPDGTVSIKGELYFAGDTTVLLDLDTIPVLAEAKDGENAIVMTSPTTPAGTYEGQLGFYNGAFYIWHTDTWQKQEAVLPTDAIIHYSFDDLNGKLLLIILDMEIMQL